MRMVTIKSNVNYKLKTTPDESWEVRASKVIVNAPNVDWKRSPYKRLPNVYDVPLRGYNADYKEISIGTAKAIAFEWTENPQVDTTRTNSFVGFLVAAFNGVLESVPIINLQGVMTEESILRSLYSAASDITRRYCPKCGKFDTIRHGRRIISCRCGYKKSAL